MNTTTISDKVHYIGVNDRTTARFESLWPLPYGVSYNSYLIIGSEKSAIIDGVEVSHALEQIAHIRSLLGDRQPDYLIINHMEPDHSGNIKLLRQAFPNLTLVGNAQTLSMINGYYGVAGNTLAIKDGDTLSLGPDATLRFTLTPMVHWPETMVTYLEQEATIFSGDAFGSFGALNGAVIDQAMDTEHYYPEMLRYYSNIVGKYGVFVQKAMKKIEGLDIRTICPTHGPVWRRDIARVINLYDKLSRYEPLDNGVAIVYGSMYGNTRQLAENAAEVLAAEGVDRIEIINSSVTDLSYILSAIFRHRGLILAAPTYSDGLFPPMAAVVNAIANRGIKNRPTLLFGSHTWAHRSTKIMGEQLAGAGLEILADPVVMKQAAREEILENLCEATRRLADRLLNRIEE